MKIKWVNNYSTPGKIILTHKNGTVIETLIDDRDKILLQQYQWRYSKSILVML